MLKASSIFLVGVLIVCGGVALLSWKVALILFGLYVMITGYVAGYVAGIKRSAEDEPVKQSEERRP